MKTLRYRFFGKPRPLPLAEIEKIAGAALIHGDKTMMIDDIDPPESGSRQSLSVFSGTSASIRRILKDCRSGAGIFPKGFTDEAVAAKSAMSVFASENPRRSLALLCQTMYPSQEPDHICIRHALSPEAKIHESAVIGYGAVVEASARIAGNTVIHPHAVIGRHCRIGRGTVIGAGAVIAHAIIGEDCVIHPQAVIGKVGFGITLPPGEPLQIPHIGHVEIEDRVHIGAQTCIDRGLFGKTVIGRDSKIGNQSHIAHNCRIGTGTVMADKISVSGSASVGEACLFGGRVSVADHLSIGRRVSVGGGSIVTDNLPDGAYYLGTSQAYLQRARQTQRKIKNQLKKHSRQAG